MKTYIILLTSLISLTSSGQKIPTFTIDSASRTSEYYTTEFRMPYGAAGNTWRFYDDFSLEYIIGSDRDRPIKLKVGEWFLSGDTLNILANPKVLKENPNYLRPVLKFRQITFKWSDQTKIIQTKGKWKGTKSTIEANVIVLVDLEKMTLSKVSTDIIKYIETNIDKSGFVFNDKEEIFEINEAIFILIRTYCEKMGLHFKVKAYINGNLINYEW